jgi:hypothetical protein
MASRMSARSWANRVTVDVLGGLDLAVSHLVGYLHVGGAGGDQQRGAHVPQLVRSVADDPIGVGSGVALGNLRYRRHMA